MNGTDDKKRSWAVFYPLMLGVAVAGGFYVGSRMGGSEVPTSRLFELRKNNPGAKLQQVLDLIERQYVDTVQKGKLVDAVLQNMLQQLDPHSYYISAADLQAAEEPLEGSFMGIGVEFSIQRDTIIVVATIEGGPSEALGIRAGDRIVNADSVKLAGVGVTNDMVMKALRGPENTKVTVGIVRGGGKPFDVTITRGPIPINSVAVSLLDDDSTGYVKLSRFARTTHEEFVKATSELKALGMKRLILDLRGNGGGYLNAAIGVCDELLPKGSGIVYTEGRASPRQDYKADGDGTLIDMPLAVLIDEGSASASEIVTGAVQDNDRALIVGRRSFGKGLVQEQINLRDNALRFASRRPQAIQVSNDQLDIRGRRSVVNLRIWSDGEPLEPSVEQHLFEPFFSSDSRSSGLGLFICRELCENQGAGLSYDRNTRIVEGQVRSGNEFSVSFRVRSPAAAIDAMPLSTP